MFDAEIRRHMTPLPHSIAPDQSLREARKVMRENEVRHLPVIEHGKLVGILSQTDIQLVDGLQGVEADAIEVKFAMSFGPLTVTPETPLVDVACLMTDRRVGSVIVTEAGRVLGIYTAHDAVRDLATVLRDHPR